ncbi:predicted protein [Histoplasma capsulatum G186AR]|uniref:Uncharacterized protein n=1 Tax=Ajellomyces capsulatus (strain G186AR / H82 / ATCC MYA-2454 / RMSCC 2432) TaxID=447093 RepID=C0NVK6_AJECG|nr:uncharacterized protein HCBG_07186 [Histoplasma capsulatum G186AR]EEH04545.1 predicted protein [Histoplasma capsulatum G186AR]
MVQVRVRDAWIRGCWDCSRHGSMIDELQVRERPSRVDRYWYGALSHFPSVTDWLTPAIAVYHEFELILLALSRRSIRVVMSALTARHASPTPRRSQSKMRATAGPCQRRFYLSGRSGWEQEQGMSSEESS